jgi:hypothetical protein
MTSPKGTTGSVKDEMRKMLGPQIFWWFVSWAGIALFWISNWDITFVKPANVLASDVGLIGAIIFSGMGLGVITWGLINKVWSDHA